MKIFKILSSIFSNFISSILYMKRMKSPIPEMFPSRFLNSPIKIPRNTIMEKPLDGFFGQ